MKVNEDRLTGKKRPNRKPPQEQTAAEELFHILGLPVVEHNTTRHELERFLLRRVAPLKVPASAEQWEKEKDALRQRILNEAVMRGHDPRIFTTKPVVRWQEVIETNHGYRIRKLSYEMWPGLWGPALIYEPVDMAGSVPVVLNPMGHSGILTNDFRQTRVINQVKRGMIAMVIEWIGSGGQLMTSREEQGYVHEAWMECFDICGRNGIAPFHTTVTRALDILLDHPNADPSRVAVTGVSSGGTQSLWIGALDERITVCIPVAGHAGNDAVIKRYSFGCPTMFPCDLWAFAGFSQWTAMLAPRPTLLIYNKYDDCCWQSEWVRPSIYDPIIPFYELYGKTDSFVYFEGTDPRHNYDRMDREAMYRFLNEHFYDCKGIDEEIPCDNEFLGNELKVDLPPNNMKIHQYFDTYAAGLPEKPLSEAIRLGRVNAWSKERRQALRENIRLRHYAAAELAKDKPLSSQRFSAKAITLKLGEDWHLPAVDIAAKGKKVERIAIVLADGGRKEASPLVRDLMQDGHRCIVADLLFIGECFPVTFGFPNAEYATHSFGERNLGLKAGQLLALLNYVARENPGKPITLAGVGITSSVTAVLATALCEQSCPDALVVDGLPASLRVLVHRSMFRAYSLFNFALLKEADISEMLALCLPIPIQLIGVESTNYQFKYPNIYAKKALHSFMQQAASCQQPVNLSQKVYQSLTLNQPAESKYR